MEVEDRPYQVGVADLAVGVGVDRRRHQEVEAEVGQVRRRVEVEGQEAGVAEELQRPHQDLAALLSHQL